MPFADLRDHLSHGFWRAFETSKKALVRPMRDTRPSQPTNFDMLPRLTLTRNSRFIRLRISNDTMCLRFWVHKRGRPPNSQGGRPQTLAVVLDA